MILPDSLKTLNITLQDTVKIIDSGSTYSDPNFYVSVIVAIVALFGLIFPYIRESIKERRRLHSLYEYILYLLKEIIKPIEDKIENLENLIKNIKDLDGRDFSFKDSSIMLIQVFLNIDHKDIYKILFINYKKGDRKEKHSHFKNIIDSIDFFNKQNEIDKINFTQFMSDLRRYENDFKENIDAILRFFDLFVSYNKRNNIKPSDDPFLKDMDVILNDWQNSQNRDSLKIIEEKILTPLKEHCSKNSEDPRAVQILPFILRCNSALLNIKTLREIYFNTYNEVKEKYISIKNKLESAIKFYNS